MLAARMPMRQCSVSWSSPISAMTPSTATRRPDTSMAFSVSRAASVEVGLAL